MANDRPREAMGAVPQGAIVVLAAVLLSAAGSFLVAGRGPRVPTDAVAGAAGTRTGGDPGAGSARPGAPAGGEDGPAGSAAAWRPGDIVVSDKEGGPDGDGSPARPFARVGPAMALARPGTRIRLVRGVYEEDLSVPPGVEVVGEPGRHSLVMGKLTVADGAHVSGVWVYRQQPPLVVVQPGARARLEQVLLDFPGPVERDGEALVEATDSPDLVLDRFLMGPFAIGGGRSFAGIRLLRCRAAVTRCRISGLLIGESREGQPSDLAGLSVQGGRVTVTGCTFSGLGGPPGTRVAAIRAGDGAELRLDGNTIQGLTPAGSTAVALERGASLEAPRTR